MSEDEYDGDSDLREEGHVDKRVVTADSVPDGAAWVIKFSSYSYYGSLVGL